MTSRMQEQNSLLLQKDVSGSPTGPVTMQQCVWGGGEFEEASGRHISVEFPKS